MISPLRYWMTLTEGLVKVPANLERSVLSLINMHLLWMLRDKAGKDYPDHRKAVIAFAKSIGEQLPKMKWVKPSNNFSVVELLLDVSDMPPNYPKLSTQYKTFFVTLDYGYLNVGSDTGAYYWHRMSKKGVIQPMIVIHMEKLRGVKEFPTRRSPDEIPYIINIIAEIIHHELQHMIQYLLLAPVDKRQIEKLPDYDEHKDAYYASQIEYDPQIGSAVADFVEHWTMMSNYHKKGQVRGGLTLSKSIKQFVGMAPTSLGNGFDISPVFRTLRRTDPDRYRMAIKKFVVAVSAKLHV